MIQSIVMVSVGESSYHDHHQLSAVTYIKFPQGILRANNHMEGHE
jgi:hypothetical protein